MLVRFFTDLRAGGVPVTLPEFLGLLEGLEARLASMSPEDNPGTPAKRCSGFLEFLAELEPEALGI